MPTESARAPHSTKYRRWTDELRRQIHAGELRPGERLPSFAAMRAEHGVSRPTVDRIHTLLADENLITRQPGRGVFVAEPGRRVPTGMLGCLSNAISKLRQSPDHRHYWSHLFDGITDAAHKADRQLAVFGDFTDEAIVSKVDGILATSPHGEDLWPVLPAVSLLHNLPKRTSVVADHESGMYAAAEHLLQLGHKRIGCLLILHNANSAARIGTYRRALLAAGIEPLARWERSLSDPADNDVKYMEYGEWRMEAWLREDWRELGLTALLAENDQAAIGAMAACRKAGLRVPEDISIVGYDGTEVSTYAHPPLTTVEVPLFEIGRRGVQELLRHIEADDAKVEHIALPTRLVVRGSTARPPSP